MHRPSPRSVVAALGFPPDLERLYERVHALSGGEVGTVASAVMRTPAELEADLGPLVARGIVTFDGDRIRVLSPTEAVTAMIDAQVAAATEVRSSLQQIVQAIPFLTAANTKPGPGEQDELGPLDGEVSAGGNPLSLLTALISQSRGDLLWFRPDAWRMPRESAIARVVAAAVASGRRSRAIYPALALQEAPEALRARAEAGEQIRVVADLPTRLFVIGGTHAVLPEPLGFADEPRVLVRQPSLVAAVTMLFELMWDRATPVLELDLGEARPDLRRFLLERMAEGDQDEQIARTLGVSLRTVRRRIAALMTEVGADTRFQVGVEAVRRGWL